MRDDRPGLDDVFLRIAYVMQIDLDGILVVCQVDDGLFTSFNGTSLYSLKQQVGCTVTVSMHDAQSRFEVVFVT